MIPEQEAGLYDGSRRALALVRAVHLRNTEDMTVLTKGMPDEAVVMMMAMVRLLLNADDDKSWIDDALAALNTREQG
jgi:hypothetical protein